MVCFADHVYQVGSKLLNVLIYCIILKPIFVLAGLVKGTVIRDRFRKCGRKLTYLGLNKGRVWFLNFSEAPLIFN
jgi:hypothetical protein